MSVSPAATSSVPLLLNVGAKLIPMTLVPSPEPAADPVDGAPAGLEPAQLSSVLPTHSRVPAFLAAHTQAAFERVVQDCATEPSCHAAFPDPRADLETVLKRLEAEGELEKKGARRATENFEGTEIVVYTRAVSQEAEAGDDLDIDQIAPTEHPLLQQAGVVALHELEAAIEVRFDPAADVCETSGIIRPWSRKRR